MKSTPGGELLTRLAYVALFVALTFVYAYRHREAVEVSQLCTSVLAGLARGFIADRA